jgi:hypothetical protein
MTIFIGGTEYALAVTSSDVVHAVPLVDLVLPQRTSCGREHFHLIDEQPTAGGFDAAVPTCKRCLAIISAPLADSPVDDRLDAVVTTLAHFVVTYGHGQCSGVPGDQMERLRAGVRSVLRAAGVRVATVPHKSLLIVQDRDWDNERPHPAMAAAERAAMARFDRMLSGESDGEPPVWPNQCRWSDFPA